MKEILIGGKQMKRKCLRMKWLTFGISVLLIGVTFAPIVHSDTLDQGFESNERGGIIADECIEILHKPDSTNIAYYAIIAACSEYKDPRQSLPIPEYALTILYDVLVNADNWYEDNIILLLNENATKQNIVNAFDEMANLVTQNDIFLFSWGGHGSQVLDDDGDESVFDPDDEYDEVICPYDCEYVDDVLTNYFRDDELDEYFLNITARGQCLLFESCYSGGLVDKNGDGIITKEETDVLNDDFLRDVEGQKMETTDINGTNRVVIMSSQPDNKSRASFLLGFPLITCMAIAFMSLAKDNDNDGWISAEEAFEMASPLFYIQQYFSLAGIGIYTYIIFYILINTDFLSNFFGGFLGIYIEFIMRIYKHIPLALIVTISLIFTALVTVKWPMIRDDYQGNLPIIEL